MNNEGASKSGYGGRFADLGWYWCAFFCAVVFLLVDVGFSLVLLVDAVFKQMW